MRGKLTRKVVNMSVDKNKFDIVIRFTPEKFKVLNSDKANEIIKDPQYYPITRVLWHGPLTVEEITEKYNNFIEEECNLECKKKGIKGEEKKKELEKRKRKIKSIYKYVKELEEVGLITEAGFRVPEGQRTTQTLWDRTAKFYIVKTQTYSWWESVEGRAFADKINKLTKIMFPDYESNDECMQNLLIELSRMTEEHVLELFSNNLEEVTEIVGEINFENLNHILRELDVIVLLMKMKEVKDIMNSCLA